VALIWVQEGNVHRETTHTVSVSKYGCAVISHREFPLGTELQLENVTGGQIVPSRVVYTLKDFSTNMVEVGLSFLEDRPNFWGIAFVFSR
jgi:hypothetical protein